MSQSERRLLSRPPSVVAAEQQRHDRAVTRGLAAFFAALVIGGGLAIFIQFSALFRGQGTLQAILESVVFVGPLLASLVALFRVPPPPFESFNDARRDMEKKERTWRAGLLSQIFIFALLAAEDLWILPGLRGRLYWPMLVAISLPMVLMISVTISALYVRPGWMSADLYPALDDEVTWSFRARAQRLGYLLMLFIALGFCLLAQINPRAAAHYLPLGLAAGTALPVLYFIYLDWQASRGG